MAFLRDASGNLIADNGQAGDAYRIQAPPAQPPVSAPSPAIPSKSLGGPQQQGMGLQQRSYGAFQQPPSGGDPGMSWNPQMPAAPPQQQPMPPMPDGGAYQQPPQAQPPIMPRYRSMPMGGGSQQMPGQSARPQGPMMNPRQMPQPMGQQSVRGGMPAPGWNRQQPTAGAQQPRQPDSRFDSQGRAVMQQPGKQNSF
jgi:hypothetical protein